MGSGLELAETVSRSDYVKLGEPAPRSVVSGVDSNTDECLEGIGLGPSIGVGQPSTVRGSVAQLVNRLGRVVPLGVDESEPPQRQRPLMLEWSQTVFGGPWGFLAACAVVLLFDLVYVLLGFGSGMLAVGMLAAILPELRDVVVILLVLMLPAEFWWVACSRSGSACGASGNRP